MKNGDERIVWRFPIIPLCIQNSWGGWRTFWLEPVRIRQQFWDGKWYNSTYIE